VYDSHPPERHGRLRRRCRCTQLRRHLTPTHGSPNVSTTDETANCVVAAVQRCRRHHRRQSHTAAAAAAADLIASLRASSLKVCAVNQALGQFPIGRHRDEANPDSTS